MTPRLLRIVLLVLLPLIVSPGGLGHSDQAGHGHLYIALGDDTRTDEVEPDDQMSYRFEGSLPVVRDEADRAVILMRIPDDAVLQRFSAPGLDEETELQIVDEGGTRIATRTWTGDGPEVGTPIDNVTFAAAQEVDPRASFVVRWSGLDGFDELAVRVEVPRDHIIASGRDLVRQVHGTGDRAVWSQHDLDSRTLEFSVRPAGTGPNPALNHPPDPYTGWLIIFGIAIVSGGAWALGKKLERNEHP